MLLALVTITFTITITFPSLLLLPIQLPLLVTSSYCYYGPAQPSPVGQLGQEARLVGWVPLAPAANRNVWLMAGLCVCVRGGEGGAAGVNFESVNS